jgi:hypothetical protein
MFFHAWERGWFIDKQLTTIEFAARFKVWFEVRTYG